MRTFLALALSLPALTLPATAFAAGSAGSDATTPPKPSETTTVCTGTQVWDEKTETCVDAKDSRLDDDARYSAVRELAYAERYGDAQAVLATMDQADDRALTYWGFTHRKLGNAALSAAYYEKAIAQNPDNILARSYMGQGMVAAGLTDAAIVQWREIKARGGDGSWAEASLRDAIRSGITYNY